MRPLLRLLFVALLVAGTASCPEISRNPTTRDAKTDSAATDDVPGAAVDAPDSSHELPCVPDCSGRECGPDGCGGSCGTCATNATCDAGSCQCVHEPCGTTCCSMEQVCYAGACCSSGCGGAVCGPDGCGGSCGACPADKPVCETGACVDGPCVADCGGKECGSDGCGGSCGTCPAAAPVCEAGDCVCEPACGGKECGPDGCGGSCGSCDPNETCSGSGLCECTYAECGGACCTSGQVCSGTSCCTPSCGGKECGPDGCGGTCGTCTGSEPVCGSTGLCQASPDGYVRVEPGTFVMGSPPDEPGHDEWGPYETQHTVKLTRAYWLKSTEVTQGEWLSLVSKNPSFFVGCGSSCPVEQVNWYEAAKYCNLLSAAEGLEVCYTLTGCVGTMGNGMECSGVSFAGPDCAGYRLPTEAEWEYAARAGTTTATYAGAIEILGSSNAPVLDAIAWYAGNSGVSYVGGDDCSGWPEKQYPSSFCGTHPVGEKAPNAWGLYDMLGNVWESCGDWYDEYPTGSLTTDPPGPSSGSLRVNRGGCWRAGARLVRAAYRYWHSAGDRYYGLGLRPARSIP